MFEVFMMITWRIGLWKHFLLLAYSYIRGVTGNKLHPVKSKKSIYWTSSFISQDILKC